ncbi:MAG: FkbM family methyltransferase [Holosporaceae bacterium]|nr:FkbM family methyltransferase [Holosporaceae bacterium]
MSLGKFLRKLVDKESANSSSTDDKKDLGGEFVRVRDLINRRIQCGMQLSTIIDVGASDSRWSAELMKLMPDTSYLLIEANSVHEEKLKKFKDEHKNVDYVLAVAGDKEGELFFDNEDPFGGVASHEKAWENMVSLPAITIDKCVKDKHLEGPYLIKLDTHGFEVPIFEGAKNALKEASLIVVEMYNFRIQKNSLIFYEMCSYLLSKGFRCVGIAEELYRPKDGVLWQFDGVFIPSSSAEFSDNGY